MKRAGIVLFSKRPKIGGRALYPLSGGRVAVLEERGNVIFQGGEDEREVKVTRFDLMEAMMMAALDPADLAPLMALDDDEWKVAVNEFSLGELGDFVGEFGELLKAEMDAVRENLSVPKKKRARKRART